ncbi:MAG: UrcA family protein [Steroidobacteraceae bacterium]|jgi:UrcA family protein
MSTLTRSTRASSLVGAAALACTCFAGNASAAEHVVPVSVPVSSQGLDLSKSEDAKTFYVRLQNAAWVVCTRGTRVDLVPSDDLRGCYEKALGDAVRSVQTPMVTLVYLATHTLQEAAAHGIQLPAQYAAK